MGRRSPPPPSIIYPPAAPPPAPTTQIPTQSLASQTALNEVSGKQQRLNMELGAQLDRTNADFFTGQDIRRGQAASAEDRLTIAKTAEENRASARVAGQEARAQTAETGLQYRRGLETAGEQDRALTRETGTEQRTTDLQKEMFRRYKENRDYEQAQSQYRT
jgi:hypothetical protein